MIGLHRARWRDEREASGAAQLIVGARDPVAGYELVGDPDRTLVDLCLRDAGHQREKKQNEWAHGYLAAAGTSTNLGNRWSAPSGS